MSRPRPFLPLCARVLLGCAPLVGGIHQLRFLPGAAAYLKDTAGWSFATPVLAGLLASLQILAAVFVLAGYRTRVAAGVLSGYYALVALAIQFPASQRSLDAVIRDQEAGQGLRSLAIAGGFLALAALGPGAHSVDRS